MTSVLPLRRGVVAWADLDPPRGREQAGRRPVLVVASDEYLDVVDTLAIVLPITSRERGWTSHVALTGSHGLGVASWVMTEQPRTIARERIVGIAGAADAATMTSVDLHLADFLALATR